MATGQKKKKRIAVISGGPSTEHEVSIRGGEKVFSALHKDLYIPEQIHIDVRGNWGKQPHHIAQDHDLAFIVMHGTYGEDGTIQSILDTHNIPYTGSDAMVSALAMNKFVSSAILRRVGISVPLTFLVTKYEWEWKKQEVFDKIKHYLHYPFVVKPNAQGSSVGVHIIRSRGDLEHAMHDVLKHGDEVIIQKYISGMELSCGVLDHGWRGSEFALLPIEIVPRNSQFFDYSAKYVPMGSEEIIPARVPDYKLREIQRVAILAHRTLGARGFSRTDMIMAPDGKLFVLELNTIPGLTEESLLPKSAEAGGIPFSKLLDLVIDSALFEKE
ncbi:D-alanine--D-alanine ligase [Candidatus Parcubacteria bacterium]|jgi:D-alanine-D-alanine ligase|nr:MAG: D-alanine--D-alanine ligase [Candidatus Parcubacteria bacterium]